MAFRTIPVKRDCAFALIHVAKERMAADASSVRAR